MVNSLQSSSYTVPTIELKNENIASISYQNPRHSLLARNIIDTITFENTNKREGHGEQGFFYYIFDPLATKLLSPFYFENSDFSYNNDNKFDATVDSYDNVGTYVFSINLTIVEVKTNILNNVFHIELRPKYLLHTTYTITNDDGLEYLNNILIFRLEQLFYGKKNANFEIIYAINHNTTQTLYYFFMGEKENDKSNDYEYNVQNIKKDVFNINAGNIELNIYILNNTGTILQLFLNDGDVFDSFDYDIKYYNFVKNQEVYLCYEESNGIKKLYDLRTNHKLTLTDIDTIKIGKLDKISPEFQAFTYDVNTFEYFLVIDSIDISQNNRIFITSGKRRFTSEYEYQLHANNFLVDSFKIEVPKTRKCFFYDLYDNDFTSFKNRLGNTDNIYIADNERTDISYIRIYNFNDTFSNNFNLKTDISYEQIYNDSNIEFDVLGYQQNYYAWEWVSVPSRRNASCKKYEYFHQNTLHI